MRGLRCLLLFLLNAPVLHAAVTLDLGFVDRNSTQYQRFRDFVDSGLSGTLPYGYSATDAAFAARIEGGAQAAPYCARAVELVEAQVAEAEALIAVGQRPAISGDSYLEVGDMIEDLALSYDWCAGATTPAQRARWAAYAEQAIYNVWHPDLAVWGGVSHPWSGWSVNDPGNNYHYSFLQATMMWALASNSTGWRNFLETEKLPAVQAYYADLVGGGSREGTGYGTSHMRLFYLYRLWRDGLGSDLSNQNSHLTDTIDYWVHATTPSMTRFAPIGDQSRVSNPEIYDFQRRLVLEARALTNNATAEARASWWLERIPLSQMQSGFNFRHDLLSLPGPSLAPTALYYHSTGSGHLFARTDWSSDALWMAFVAGRYDQSHAHQDQGAFTLNYQGWLAVTENVWSRSGIQQGPEVHNVLRFVQAGATIPQREGTTSTVVVTPGADGALAVDANLTPAYGIDAPIQHWRRQLAFANRAVLVTDDFTVSPGVSAIWQVNVPTAPAIVGRSARVGNLLIEVLQPNDAVLSVLDWSSIDPSEFLSGYKIEVQGSGGQYVVRLSESGTLFSNGFE